MNKKIIAVILGIVMVGAGIGIYYGLTQQGYVNPGISINSFSSSSNGYMNNSSVSNIPIFYAHVDSSKTSEYELAINGKLIFHGVVTGKENISFPTSISQFITIASCIGSPGLHTLTFSVLFNSFKTTKSLNIYTFPYETFNVSHYNIDTGIADQITASNPVDNISINGHSGGTYNFIPNSAGCYNLSYNLAYNSYHYSGTAANINVFNKPVPTGLSYSNYTYCSCFFSYSSFNLNMNESGGDTYSQFGESILNYSIYVNGSYYTSCNVYYSTFGTYPNSEAISYTMELDGQGPFYIYFTVGDRYYTSTASHTIEVG